MNEFIEVTFRRGTRRLRVKRQVPGGIEFEEPDPIERTVGLQLTGRGDATRQRMRRIAQVKGWDLGTFKLTMAVEDGNVILRGVDPDALPEGLYALKVEIEEARCKQATRNIEIVQDGFGSITVEVMTDDRDVAIDLDEADEDIQRVIDASTIEEIDAAEWLESRERRPARKACFLNLMASLRVRPQVSAGLIEYIDSTFKVFNDRAFMKVDKSLLPRIQELVLDPTKPFYAEGKPTDVLGFVVHMGELLDGKPTNHLDLRKQLAKTSARDYLYYTID